MCVDADALTFHHGSHQRTDATETTLGPGRSPLNRSSVRASPHDESPTGFAQRHPPARSRGRDAAPTDKLGRRRARGRALGAGAGARGASLITCNPEAATRRFTNRSHTRQRHGETNHNKRNNRRRLLRLCGGLVSTLITSATGHGGRSNNSWTISSTTPTAVSGQHALV